MNLSFNESVSFCKNNKEQLEQLATNNHIILCPSFIALAPIAEIFKSSAIAVGAQNCSEYENGSYTGEVSAQSLAEVGATYCFIGHSERRIYYGETTETIVKKIDLLYKNNITPIICIGETKEDFLHKKTFDALTQQLELILKTIAYQKYDRVIIAYEPFWAIGTGIIPEDKYLEEIFAWLQKYVDSYLPHIKKQLLYGGSVDEKNIHQLKNISDVDGFLVGSASTDCEKFKKIITT